MGSTTERTGDQNREQGRIDRILNTPMSRRRFLKVSGAVLSAAMIAEACGIPQGTSGTMSPDGSNPALSPGATIPVENSPLPHIDTLTGDTFTKAFSNFGDTTEVKIPSAKGTITKSGKDLVKYASDVWNDDITTHTVFFNSTHALKLALSSADMTGKDGTVDISQMFPELSLKLSRLNLSALPNGKDTETAINVFPKNLVLRKGMNMIVVGVDDSTKEAIVAFVDTLRKPDKIPTMYLSALPLEVQGETDGQVSLNELLARSGAAYESSTHSIIYENGETLLLNSLDSVLSKNLHQAAGSYFLDHDPLKKNIDGTPAIETNPVIPTPDAAIVPTDSKIEQLPDGRVVAVNSRNKPIARAENVGEWKWVGPDKAAGLGYFFREYADALGIKIGTSPDSDPFSQDNATYKEKDWEYFNHYSIYLEPWTSPNSPPGGDKLVAFAENHDMSTTGYLIGSISSDIPDWIKDPKYSATDVRNFVKDRITQVLSHLEGRVENWVIINEPVWGTSDGPNFWQQKFGSNYKDFLVDCFKWAHGADPKATLLMNDMVNEGRDPKVSQGFYELVKYLMAHGAPIGGVGMEMHMHFQWDNPQVEPNFSPAVMAQWIKKYKDIGLEVDITEFDADMTTFKGTKAEEEAFQASWYYKGFLTAALNAGVDNFTIWGLTDNFSWYNDPSQNRPNADALILRADYSAKPSFLAMQKALHDYYESKS